MQIGLLTSKNSLMGLHLRLKDIEGPFLPHDIIFEILSWMPGESLLRCKSVCKQWYYLIQDRNFITQHLSRVRNVCVYFEHEVAGLNVDGTIQEKFRKMNNAMGLIVEKGNVTGKYRVRNPTTRQVLYLPDPHQRTVRIFLSDYDTSGELKLLSVYRNSRSYVEGFEVLTMDRDDKWRPLKHIPIFNEVLQEKKNLWCLSCCHKK